MSTVLFDSRARSGLVLRGLCINLLLTDSSLVCCFQTTVAAVLQSLQTSTGTNAKQMCLNKDCRFACLRKQTSRGLRISQEPSIFVDLQTTCCFSPEDMWLARQTLFSVNAQLCLFFPAHRWNEANTTITWWQKSRIEISGVIRNPAFHSSRSWTLRRSYAHNYWHDKETQKKHMSHTHALRCAAIEHLVN